MEREQNREQLEMLDKNYQTERWTMRIIVSILSIMLLAAVAVIFKEKRKLRQ